MKRFRSLRVASAIFLAASLLAGCSSAKNEEAAEAEVPLFHQALDAGHFGELFDAAGDDIQKSGKREDFVAFLAAVHRKLGNVKTSTKTGWQVNMDLKGELVTLIYKTEFAEGKGVETFAYRFRDDKPILVGYHINAPALILK